MKELKNYTFYTAWGTYETTAYTMAEALYNMSNHKQVSAGQVIGGKIEFIN